MSTRPIRLSQDVSRKVSRRQALVTGTAIIGLPAFESSASGGLRQLPPRWLHPSGSSSSASAGA